MRWAKHRLCVGGSFPLTPRRSLAAQPPNFPRGDEAWPPRLQWIPRVGQYFAVGPRLPALPLGWATTGSDVGRSIKPARCPPVAAQNESVDNSYRLSHNGQLQFSQIELPKVLRTDIPITVEPKTDPDSQCRDCNAPRPLTCLSRSDSLKLFSHATTIPGFRPPKVQTSEAHAPKQRRDSRRPRRCV